jgi:Zn-dependent peptidase ImmA (M78 family)
MHITEARSILKDYLERMDLTEWTVLLRWGKIAEMADVDGKCVWSPEYASCEILLNKRQPDSSIAHTIVHELCHVALQGHKDHNGGYSAMYERGINRIATAILR